MKYIFILLLSVFFTDDINAQTSKKKVTTSFHVAGICGMCERTIERALDAKGIVAADFNLDTNTATVTYNTRRITEDQIHRLINAVGYDTEKYKATDEEYNRVHDCCKYREQEKH